jgi:outer membrane protein
MKAKVFIFAFSLLLSLSAWSQTETSETKPSGEWTLRQCIEYAIAHNISIQQSAITARSSELEMNTNKWARLPEVTGSASQGWSWGRAASPVDNSYSDTHSSNTSFSVGANVPLFTGMRIPNQYKLSQSNLKANLADLQKAKDDLSINIASNYLQALLDKELCKIDQEQIKLSKQQLDRLVKMEELGKASPAEVAEARSNVEQYKLTAVQNENSYKLAMLDLSQMLELSSPEGFEIVQPEVNINFAKLTPPDEIYNVAVNQKASILASKYRLEGSDYSIKIARSTYMPSLSLSLGLSTSYYTMKGLNAESFGSQLNNNLNKYIGLSLSIPIFDRFSTRNNIRTAKIQQLNLSLQLENSKKTLYKEIQQAWYNALAAENKYNSSISALDASKASFELVRAKYENGRATAVEYNEAQVKLRKSESDLIQAKYDYIFRSKILDFYKGEKIE